MAKIDTAGATWQVVSKHATDEIERAREALEYATDYEAVARMQARIDALRRVLNLAVPQPVADVDQDDSHALPG